MPLWVHTFGLMNLTTRLTFGMDLSQTVSFFVALQTTE